MIKRRHKEILEYIFQHTTTRRYWQIDPIECGFGKRFYQRVKDLEQSNMIRVDREKGQPSLYAITDNGINLLEQGYLNRKIIQENSKKTGLRGFKRFIDYKFKDGVIKSSLLKLISDYEQGGL